MIIDSKVENKKIANQYKELLRISYQTLGDSDKKMIRLAFDMAVEAHGEQRKNLVRLIFFIPLVLLK